MVKLNKLLGDDEGEDKEKKRGNPTFNMGIASLELLDKIRQAIAYNSIDPDLTEYQKQKNKVSLVKSYMICSLPLISKGLGDELKEKVANFKPICKITQKAIVGNLKNIKTFEFDWDLDKELDEAIMEVEKALQDLGFFMPGKKKSMF